MRVEHWRRGARYASNGFLLWFALWSMLCTTFAGRPHQSAAQATRQAVKDASGMGAVGRDVQVLPIGGVIHILLRLPRTGPPPGGGGGANLPYGAAALPTGMAWNYTEGGTRTVTGSPLSFSIASVPTVTGTVYDASSEATWATAVAAAVPGDGIRITADFNTASRLSLPNTTDNGGWIVVYTDRKATLDAAHSYNPSYLGCTSSNRIANSETTLVRTITQTTVNLPCVGCAQSARGYWFIGVRFTTSVNVNEALVDFGATTVTQESHIPQRMVLDRCIVDGADRTKRGVNVNTNHIFINGCDIDEIVSTPLAQTDSIGLACFTGSNVLYLNNKVAAESESIFFGAAVTWDGSTRARDVAVIGNHITKNAAWDAYTFKKNLIETKACKRLLIFRNVGSHYRKDQQFHAIVLKAESVDPSHTQTTATDITLCGNRFTDCASGGTFQISPAGSTANAHQGMKRLTIVHTYFDTPNGADESSTFQLAGSTSYVLDDLHVEHNTWPASDTFLKWVGNLDENNAQRVVFRNVACITTGLYGPVFTSSPINKLALDRMFTAGYTFAKNALVSGGTASWGNGVSGSSLLVSPYNCIETTAAAMFTNPGTNDWSAKTGGPLDGTATDGRMVGADVPWVLSLTAGVV